MDATKKVESAKGTGVPWYYEQAADIYRADEDIAAELAVLERFARQTHARGVKPPKLVERLAPSKESGHS